MAESDVALITGCSSGFGELIAKTLASKGYRVYASMRAVNGRNAEAAQSLKNWAQAQGVQLEVVELDVADPASVKAAIDQILGSAGRIDIVVNNAGIAAGGPLEAFDIEQMQALYDINVWGPIRVDKAVLPQMRQRRSGLLIHVTSTLGRVLPHSGGLYPASKWAAEGLAETLHYQVKPFSVNVVILEPGAFPTPAIVKGMDPNDAAIAAEYAAVRSGGPRRVREISPDYVPPDPQEVADLVLRLAEMPPEKRPLRVVVGPIFTEGVKEYNETYEKVRDRLAERLADPDQAVTWGR
jgi:NAD(P)-dependent dehydrogenase (short-subunit alcohol dehydrogenase family)